MNVKGREPSSAGRAVAALLAGSWRPRPEPSGISEAELSALLPHLRRSGGAALAWRRVRRSDLVHSRPAQDLLDAHRRMALQEALDERAIASLADRLASAGIDPVLLKGWSLSRLYPERGLRPSGDIDLMVRGDQYAAAQAVIRHSEAPGRVDLHGGFGFEQCRSDEMFSRVQRVRAGHAEIGVLGPEDALRFLCLHLLKHSAWRPLWACDVALVLESRPPDFDWDYCLRGPAREANWVLCAIGLADRLLGARIDDTPAAARARKLPAWLVRTVLWHWGSPRPPFRMKMGVSLTGPLAALRQIPQRLPDPIEATVRLRAPFNGFPRLPFQIANVVWRGAAFVANLPEHLEARRRVLAERRIDGDQADGRVRL